MATGIQFREVSFRTPQGRLLLDAISFQLEEGTTTAILGRSGSGKTTLLRTVNRMVDATSGDGSRRRPKRARGRPHRPAPRHRLRHPGDRPVSALHRRAQRGRGARGHESTTRRAPPAAAANCWQPSASIPTASPPARRISSPAASASASAWPAPSPPSPAFC